MSSTPGPRWLSPAELRAWLAYRRMRALLDLRLGRELQRSSALSEADYDVLSTLSERDDAWRMGELAGRLLWTPSRLAHQVGRMEARGLVARSAAAHDARGAQVRLTRAGRRVLEAAAPLHVAAVRDAFVDLLSPSDVRALTAIGERIIAALGDGTRP